MLRCLVVTVALVAVCCGGCSGDGPADPTATSTPEELIAGAVTAMQGVAAARFEMTRTGAPVAVQGLVFNSAVGRYAAPAAAEAVLRMHAGDLAVELGTISLGERTWLTNPLTGRWEELRPGSGFNPAVLFDPADGWVALLTDLTDTTVVSTAGDTYRLAGTVPARRVESLTVGLAPGQAVLMDLWLDAGTLHIVRLEFSTVSAEGRSDWVIVMSAFDTPVQIEPPAVR